jgi:hypothetical protein
MDNSKSALVPDEVLINKIYLLRGQRIMLDRDLAGLYGVKAIRLREQVKRNQSRFPCNFMFQLSDAHCIIFMPSTDVRTTFIFHQPSLHLISASAKSRSFQSHNRDASLALTE